MNLLAPFAALMLAASLMTNNAQASQIPEGYVRLVVKYPSSDLRRLAIKHDYGLTELQKNKLYTLTGADLREIYEVDVPAEEAKDIIAVENVLEKYDRVMPPPVFVDGVADPELKDQWWIEKLKVKEAWEVATGKGVTVADCDAGYYIEESDIRGNLLLNYAKDFSNTDQPDKIDDGPYTMHGTAVSAITTGVLDGSGTNGIAYNSKFVPLQNYNYDSRDKLDKEEATAKCILGAITIPNVRIIMLENQTYGSSETYVGTREAVRAALKAGITIVSAAGNSGNELVDEAKDDTGSIIVGALEPNGTRAKWSNWGKRVSIAAFGRNLWTLFGPEGKFGNFGGTSGATPQVGATVALMLEANPDLTPSQIKMILEKTRIESRQTEGVGGLMNTYSAVVMAKETKAEIKPLADFGATRAAIKSILRD